MYIKRTFFESRHVPIIERVLNFILHIDRHLNDLIQAYGLWTYLILFGVIFLETGFVVTPFLPGDSLLFAAGTFAAVKSLNLPWLIVVLSGAAVLGDTANYWIGHFVGPRVFSREKTRLFKKEYLERTHRFYEKYGAETIIIARFVPIIRTFAPFVAGIGRMSYWKFISYNVIGGVGWVTLITLGGYLFGNIPLVRRNFGLVIIAIIIVSTIPAAVEYLRHRRETRQTRP
jgi:membrane-associated protein